MDSGVHKLWSLDDHMSQHSLLNAIDNIKMHHRQMVIDVDDVFDFVRSEAFSDRIGDRKDVPNDIVLFVDHRANLTDAQDLSTSYWGHNDLSRLSGDVIVVIVGGSSGSLMERLATDPSHVLYADSYSNLSLIKQDLLTLLCD